jgi:hypothetical protein
MVCVMTQRRTRVELSLKFHRTTTREGRVPKQRSIEVTKTADRGHPRRTIRVPDTLWDQARDRAAGQHLDISKVVRVQLTAYLAGQLDELVSGGLAADEPS